MADNMKKTGALSRFIIRRDRIRIPLWLIGIVFFTLIVPIAFTDLYPSQEDRTGMAETMENPAMTAMVGPGDLSNYTIGAMTAHQMLLLTAVVVGIMSILLVTRHTRADEEDGRIEMVRSLPVGRLSNLNATLFVLGITNVILALITGFGLYALGIESMGMEGSLLYGAALGATGIFFAGVTALFAQLSENSRGTTGFSIAVLIIAYLVRAVGDVGNEALSWISPLGWVTQTEAYATNNWWPIVLMLGVSIILFILANYLNAVRDLEAGFFPARPGRKYASSFLQSPIGLALRLQRTGIIAWAIGMFVMGISYGSIMGDLESFFAGNEVMEQMLMEEEGYTLTEQFIPMLMIIMALLATVPPIMAMNKLYGEEKKNRIEHLLGRAVSRTRLMGSYVVISIVNGFIMLSLTAIGLWAAGAAVMEDGFAFGTIYGAALVYYPAMLVMIGLAVLLIGFLPRLASLIWLYVFYSFIVLYLGGLFQFPDWVGQLSPYGHISQLPVEEMEWVPVVILTVTAVVLLVVGFIGYRKRDMEG
ncbi:ABC-2 type transport system permease protein [Virgibacillus natechei]|uniref:ABC-2 type transport system permease protein n=1 Tax=Virgibacillus natechei TaxID=1216297 RepID=A0ABS4IBL6_9BACI|nr:ABC transporter permease [Virgibacillus natechei]MBP1968341.1 ABC-2 type transport system permease protein [Virgibacillus natechei]UZD13474.1 ABC transporter permease [Virgibacillus natechei]